MEIDALFGEETELELRSWAARCGNLAALYGRLSELFSKLKEQQIDGAIEDCASLVGPIHIGSRSIVCPSAMIIGPAIVAEDVRIASSVEIGERTYIGRGCSISHGATIKNSLILNGTSIGAGAYISDSLVGTGCMIGARAILGVEPISAAKGNYAGARFVAAGMRSRIGAGAILEFGTELAKHAAIENGATWRA